MGGRNLTPLSIYNGQSSKGHRTKAELKQREEQEIKLGLAKKIKMPKELKGKKNAVQKWKWVVKLYEDADLRFLNYADEQLLARYCVMYEDYLDLINSKDQMVLTIDDQVKYTNQLTKFSDKLLKYEECLYLTPQARAKGIGKPAKKEKPSEMQKKFGDV